MWGWAPVPATILPQRLRFASRNVTAAYLVEYRTGFPFNVVDQQGFLVGAPAGTMVMATNVSQIQALVASCLDYTPARNRVVFTALNFPTVSYVWHEERRRGAEQACPSARQSARCPGARYAHSDLAVQVWRHL